MNISPVQFSNMEFEVLTIKAVKMATCHQFKINEQKFNDRTKNFESAKPRYIAAFLCKEMTQKSFNVIGLHLGGYDASTIAHGAERIAKLIETDEKIATTVSAIRERLTA
jgi:chromosomal replication initiator protein